MNTERVCAINRTRNDSFKLKNDWKLGTATARNMRSPRERERPETRHDIFVEQGRFGYEVVQPVKDLNEWWKDDLVVFDIEFERFVCKKIT